MPKFFQEQLHVGHASIGLQLATLHVAAFCLSLAMKDRVDAAVNAGRLSLQVIPTPSHLLDRISPISPPFFSVFCAFSPSRRGGSNESQAGTRGQETAARSARRLILAVGRRWDSP